MHEYIANLVFLESEHIVLVALLAEVTVERVDLANVTDVALDRGSQLPTMRSVCITISSNDDKHVSAPPSTRLPRGPAAALLTLSLMK